MIPVAYRVRGQLVGRSGQPLDDGCLAEGFCAYGDAVAAVAEFLRAYPEVSPLPEGRLLARAGRAMIFPRLRGHGVSSLSARLVRV
jgi:hypothetical protein